MGRSQCSKGEGGINKGPWTEAEDATLTAYIKAHGEGNWRLLPKCAGLSRCGKSCRLRWLNYLRPGLKRGKFSWDEEDLIVTLHALLGNRWSLIAGRIPGRTDNEIKNYWNTHLSRKLRNKGIDPCDHKVGQLTLTSKDTADRSNSELNAGQFIHHQPITSAEKCTTTSSTAYSKYHFPGDDCVHFELPQVNTIPPDQGKPISSPNLSYPNSYRISDGSNSSGDCEYLCPNDQLCCMDRISASDNHVLECPPDSSHHYAVEQQNPIFNADMPTRSISGLD